MCSTRGRNWQAAGAQQPARMSCITCAAHTSPQHPAAVAFVSPRPLFVCWWFMHNSVSHSTTLPCVWSARTGLGCVQLTCLQPRVTVWEREASLPAVEQHRSMAEATCAAGCRYKLVDKIPIRLGLADGRFTTMWHGKDLTNNRDVVLKVCRTTTWLADLQGLLAVLAALVTAARLVHSSPGLQQAVTQACGQRW